MATSNIDRNNIPLKAYLRADSHSQHFQFTDQSGELVTEEMFWGDNNNKGLYLDYHFIDERNINVSVGISETATIETKRDDYCDNWIEENLKNKNISKLFVVQGYAGCGKTTFINHLMRQTSASKNIYIDIGQDWAYPQEPYMFFNETLNKFDLIIREIVSLKQERDIIWKKFVELGNYEESVLFDIEIKNIITRFEDIKKEKKWKKLESGLHSFLFNYYSDKGKKK